ncbi:CoA transferase, partial [Porticoccaceae bacterium]|nr:CoA transferase [Porticoccaceae bacterium]
QQMSLGSQQDPHSQKQFRAMIEAKVAEKTLAEWSEIFDPQDACVEPVLSLAEACSSEQIKQRDLIVDIETYQGTTQKQIGSPIKFSASAPTYGRCGAPLGEHSEEILEQAGFSTAEISRAQKSGILG